MRLLVVLLLLVCGVHAAHMACAGASADLVEVAVSPEGDLQLSDQHAIPASADERPDATTIPAARGANSDAFVDQLPAANETPESAEHQPQYQHVASPQRQEQTRLAKTALTKELEALELMIKLQEKKLALLETIRSKALSDQDADSVPDHSTSQHKLKLFNEQVEDLIERKIEAMAAGVVQDLIGASGQTNAFDTLFVAKAVIPTKHRIVDMKMMKLRSAGHQELVVVAFADGAIEFYLSPALMLLRMEPAEHLGLSICSLELDLHSDSPSLAITYQQPRAAVYSLELTENGRHLMGNQQDNATAIPIGATIVFSSESNVPFTLKVAQLSSIELSSVPRALVITKTSRRSVLSIGSDDGSLEFFALNGTSLHKMVTNASIQTMATHRSLVAFNNGSDTVLLPLARGREAAFVVCPGSTAQVTSIAFDPQHSDLVYAGTSRGEVLVYSTKDSGGAPPSPMAFETSNSSPGGSCKMVSRALLLKRGAPLSKTQQTTKVYAIKGYVIASTGSSVAVYNVSRVAHDGAVSMDAVCTLETSDFEAGFQDKGDFRPMLVVSEGTFVTNIALVALNRGDSGVADLGSEIQVFQSLLSSKIEKTDTSWVGFLYVGIIITVVLICQFCFRKQQPQHPPPSDFDPWGALNNNRSTAAAAVARGPRGSSYGVGDSSRFGDDGRFDLEHLSQEMKAKMNNRTARDVRGFNATATTATAAAVGGGNKGASLSDRERFGPSYDALSDDLKRKIAEARKGTLECAFDDDYEDEEEEVDGF